MPAKWLDRDGGKRWIGRDDYGKIPRVSLSTCLKSFSSAALNTQQHSKVPQRVYVAPNGVLKFTAANFPHPPHESSSGPFKVGFSTIAGRSVGGYILYFGKGSRPGGSQIIFCPTNEPPQVFNAGYRVTPLQAFVDIGGLSDADVPLGSVADCIRWEVVTETYPALQASPPNAWEYV